MREGWADRIVAAHEAGRSVVGGSIRNFPYRRVRDWAAFFCEYSRYMEPAPAGAVDDLPGMNVSYDRRALEAIDDLLHAGKLGVVAARAPARARLRALVRAGSRARPCQGLRLSRVPVAALPLLALVRRHAQPPSSVPSALLYALGLAADRAADVRADRARTCSHGAATGASSRSRRR